MSLHLLSPYRRRAWFPLGALLCLLITACGQAFAAPSPCLPRTFEGSNYIICTMDLRACSLRLFWKDEKGQPYGGFERLPRSLNGAPMAFAMNAGMYDPDLSPTRPLHRGRQDAPTRRTDPATSISSRTAFSISAPKTPPSSSPSVFWPKSQQRSSRRSPVRCWS